MKNRTSRFLHTKIHNKQKKTFQRIDFPKRIGSHSIDICGKCRAVTKTTYFKKSLVIAEKELSNLIVSVCDVCGETVGITGYSCQRAHERYNRQVRIQKQG